MKILSLGRKRVVLLLGIVVLLVAAMTLGTLVLKNSDSDKQGSKGPQPICNDELLRKFTDAASVFKADVEKLRPVAAEVEALPGYDKDPNCVYVLLAYELEINDAKKILATYEKLRSVYDPEVGYAESIQAVARTPDDLKPKIDFIAAEEERFKKVRRGQYSGGYVPE